MQPTKTLTILALALSSALTATALPLDTDIDSTTRGIKAVQAEPHFKRVAMPITEGPVGGDDVDEEVGFEPYWDENDVEGENEDEDEVEIEARNPSWNPWFPCRFWWCR